MKSVIKGALALALLASTAPAAFAQDQEQDQGELRNSESRDDTGYNPAMRASTRNVPPSLQRPPEPPQPPAPSQPPAPPQPQESNPGGQGGGHGDPNGQPHNPPGQPGQQPDGQHWNNGQHPEGQGWTGQNPGGHRHDRHDRNPGWNDYSGWNNNQGWNNYPSYGGDWNQQRPNFDRRYYGRNYSSPQRYRGYSYRPPSGFYIRSWGYGDLMPRTWYGSQYRLSDWWNYGLPIPPIGYEWVRVGDDVVLVDIFNGRVAQVIHRVFW